MMGCIQILVAKYLVQHQLCRIDNFTGSSNLVVFFMTRKFAFVGM